MEYLETQYSQPVKHTDKRGKSISTHFIDQLMDHPWAMRLYFANQPSISEENPLLYSGGR